MGKRKAKRKTFDTKEVPVKFLMDHLSSPVSIYDSRKGKFIYVNPPFCNLTGLTAEEVYAMPLAEYLTRVHAKDLLVVLNEVAKKVRDACSRYIKNKKQQLVYTINYRLKQKDGKYCHVMVQCTVLEWYRDLKRSVSLNLYTDISNHKNDHKIVLNISVFNAADNLWKTVLTEEFLGKPEMLSERECEVMKLMVIENTAGEIAKKLNIKFYTVRAHWRNILGKTNCKTQKDLKELARKEGWI